MNTLTQQEAHRLLDYDPNTGVFRWKLQRRGVSTGRALGTDNGFGYLRITVCGHSHYAHRLAWLYVHGVLPDCEVDHINGNKSDNRISNLRLASRLENAQNKHRPQSNNKSGHLGISWHKKAKKWQVHICSCRKRHYLGVFETIEEAQIAYLKAKQTMHPFAIKQEYK